MENGKPARFRLPEKSDAFENLVYAETGLCRDPCGFLGGLARLLKDFALGANPVFQWIAWSAIALEIDFIGAELDFLP